MSGKESSDTRSRTIREKMWHVLRTLAEEPRDESGEAWMSGSQIRESTNLSPSEINDAINLLLAQGLVESVKTYTTAPFGFALVTITSKGRYAIEQIESRRFANVKKKEKRIEPLPPWEEVVASGLSKLGYELIENMTVAPSGSSIDFVMRDKDQLIGVEVKAGHVEPDDLRGAIDTRSNLGLDNMMVISKEEFRKETQEFAEEHGIRLNTIENILAKMDEAKISTTQLKRNISNLLQFAEEQPKPKERLIEEFRIALDNSSSAKTNKEKKDSLEKVGVLLIKMIEGLDVLETNVNTETEEIDILVKNESEDPFWQRLPTPFLVECKNWSKPVGAKEIRDFDGKMDEITFRIMISIDGVTGKSERKAAKGVIRDARIKGRHIIVLDKEDLKDVASGMHPAEKINAKFYEIYKL